MLSLSLAGACGESRVAILCQRCGGVMKIVRMRNRAASKLTNKGQQHR